MQIPKKNVRFRLNPYEKKIVILIIGFPLLWCIILSIMYNIFYQYLVDLSIYGSSRQVAAFSKELMTFLILALWGFLLLFYIWTRLVASNMLGAFERLLRELDEINESRTKKRLICRKNDTLAYHLIKRLNTLMDLIEFKQKDS